MIFFHIRDIRGKIYPVDEVKISPDVPGEVKELLVKEGDEVKSGPIYLFVEVLIYNNMKKCRYRNCRKEIASGRSDKEFCNRSCKKMEQTYRKREKMKNEKVNTRRVHK